MARQCRQIVVKDSYACLSACGIFHVVGTKETDNRPWSRKSARDKVSLLRVLGIPMCSGALRCGQVPLGAFAGKNCTGFDMK